MHGSVKQTQFCVSFITPWWRNGGFQRRKAFLIGLCSDPHLWSWNLRWWLKEYCQKNKRQRWDICEEFSVWHFMTRSTGLKSIKLGMSSHFFESRDPSNVGSAMCPEFRRKDKRGTTCWLHPRESGPEVVRGSGGLATSAALLCPVLVWTQGNWNCLIVRRIRSSHCCPRDTAKGKKGGKMSEWMSM